MNEDGRLISILKTLHRRWILVVVMLLAFAVLLEAWAYFLEIERDKGKRHSPADCDYMKEQFDAAIESLRARDINTISHVPYERFMGPDLDPCMPENGERQPPATEGR